MRLYQELLMNLSDKIVITVLRLVSNCSNEPGMWNFGSFVEMNISCSRCSAVNWLRFEHRSLFMAENDRSHVSSFTPRGVDKSLGGEMITKSDCPEWQQSVLVSWLKFACTQYTCCLQWIDSGSGQVGHSPRKILIYSAAETRHSLYSVVTVGELYGVSCK